MRILWFSREFLFLLLVLGAACVVHAQDSPFQTTADMQVYYTDTHGIVRGDGGAVTFVRRGIDGVRVAGEALPVLRRGRNWVQVTMPEGEHEVEIATVSGRVGTTPVTGSSVPTKWETVVASVEELLGAVKAAKPGDTIAIRNGFYTDWQVRIECSGTADKPIVIRPETPGGVTFMGRPRIELAGDWCVFREFRFEYCARMALLISGGDCNRITQCQFFYCGAPHNTFGHIVSVLCESHRNRVDHCYWTGSTSMSLGLVNDRKNPTRVGKHNHFDHNVFRDVFRLWINGQENIQLGSGYPWDAAPQTLIEYNLFDNAWGDSEICSSKTSQNIFRYNVMANCIHASLTLRGGNGARIEGNVIVNCANGLRVYGQGHRVINNLIMNCRGAGVMLCPGHESPHGSRGFPATACLFAHNTFINNGSGICASGADKPDEWRPKRNHVVNNIFQGGSGIFVNPRNQLEPVVENNLFWGLGTAEIGMEGTAAKRGDPMLVGEGAAIAPAADSPAVNAAKVLPEPVTTDRAGRSRDASPDLGADEVCGVRRRGRGLLARLLGGRKRTPGRTLTAVERLMPTVPSERTWSTDLYKGELLCDYDVDEPVRFWHAQGSVAAESGTIVAEDATLTLGMELPAEFVAEWDFHPETFAATGCVEFGGDAASGGYRFEWAGAGKDGKPRGLVLFSKNGTSIATTPDPVQYRRNYIPSWPGKTIGIKADSPVPGLWYKCRLIRHGGIIRFVLNKAARRASPNPADDWDIPLVAWEDTGDIAGAPLTGTGFALRQQGKGVWRNLRVWRAAYVGDRPPPSPSGLTATPKGGGCVVLEWATDQAAGITTRSYEVFRGTKEGFRCLPGTLLATGIRGSCYTDFEVKASKKYFYNVRALNLLGVPSAPASVSTKTGRSGDEMYLLLGAADHTAIEKPMAVARGETGESWVWAPPGTGGFMKEPPEKGVVTYSFETTAGGAYYIWCRVSAPDTSHDSFWAQMSELRDGKPFGLFPPAGHGWCWKRLNGSDPIQLVPGTHQISFRPREDGSKLNKILVTNDLTWHPQGGKTEGGRAMLY